MDFFLSFFRGGEGGGCFYKQKQEMEELAAEAKVFSFFLTVIKP